MPIYEYSCRKCGGHVEAMQKVSDKPLTKHAGCGGRLEKQWSRTGFQFKGSGWYVTDYAGRKAKAEGEAAGGEAKAEAAPEAKEAKAGAKPEAAAAAKKTPKPKSPSKGASAD